MRKSLAVSALVTGLLALLVIPVCAAPTISIVGDNKSSYPNGEIPRYEKFEVSFTVGNVGTAFTDYNPFNPNTTQPNGNYWNKKGILVDAILTKPNGSTVTWPCFWYEGSDGWKGWKLRFSPDEVGAWSYRIQVKYGSDTVQSSPGSFSCTSSSNKGFIGRSSDSRFFQFQDGTPFYPMGSGTEGWDGVGWVSKHQQLFPKMAANGINFARLFSARTDNGIEACNSATVDLYDQKRCRDDDSVMDLAKQNGIHVTFMLDDWTWFKDGQNGYIGYGGPCSSATDEFNGTTRDGLNNAREIYKRKIRYVLARWGYSTNLFAVEMMNECYGSGNSWHSDMGKYVHTFTAQPHMAVSSLGSSRMRSAGIDWTSSGMDYVNFHDYARISDTWTRLEYDNSPVGLEKLGCNLAYPWYDTAVWIDRLARLHYKRQNRGKPLIYEEFGLISVSSTTSDSGWGDWTSAYKADTTGRHNKDAIWAGMLSLCPVLHWKSGYLLGVWGAPADKYWMYKPLSNFVAGENFVGLKQESAYGVSDPINPSPTLTTSNRNIMAISLHGSDRAYIYVKNLTDCWYRFVNSSAVPTPSSQSGTVKVYGLDPGTYTLEKWSTSQTDINQQKVQTTQVNVGSDGVASINVSVATGSNYDWAYKLKKSGGTITNPPNISLTIAADKSTAKPGETIIYTVSYKNTGTSAASNVVVAAPVPANTTYVAGSGGTLSSGQVKWTIPSVAVGGAGTVSFKVTVN